MTINLNDLGWPFSDEIKLNGPGFHDLEYLDWLKSLYEMEGKKGKNPVFAWMAYHRSRSIIKQGCNFTIPEWILSYLDEAANRLLELGPGKQMAQKISAALMLDTAGRNNAFVRAIEEYCKLLVVKEILARKQGNPERNLEDIFKDVAGWISSGGRMIEIITVKNWYYQSRRIAESAGHLPET
jgi:hypothetical protein